MTNVCQSATLKVVPKTHPRAAGKRWCTQCGALVDEKLFPTRAHLCRPHWQVYNKERAKRFATAHPNYAKEKDRRRRERDPEGTKARNARTIAKQRSLGWASNMAWTERKKAEDPEAFRAKRNANMREWYKQNPEKLAAIHQRRRARRFGVAGHHTASDLVDRSNLFTDHCVYCGGTATAWDHVVPLASGGTNFPWNLVPACKPCNSAKNAKDPLPFIEAAPPEYREALLEALRLDAEINKSAFRRNPYEKVPLGCLEEELRRLAVNGEIDWTTVCKGRYSATTYSKRFGSLSAAATAAGVVLVDGRKKRKKNDGD